MKRRHDSYEDYAKEIDEEAEKLAHENFECADWCPYCADDEEQMSKDVDEMADHVNKELDNERMDAYRAIVAHVLAIADDTYLVGHPEWLEIVKESRALLK